MKKTMLALCLFAAMFCAAGAFSDVPQGYWAQDYIERMSGEGVIKGMPDGTFAPESVVTRAEFLTMVVRAADVAVGEASESVAWWEPYYNAAAANDLLPEIDGRLWVKSEQFMNVRISREEMALVLYRAIGQPNTGYQAFPDVYSSEQSIGACAKWGLLTGYPDGTFQPKDVLTRAEAAAVLTRLSAWKSLEDDAEIVCTIDGCWIMQKTDWKGTEITCRDMLSGEVVDAYFVPMDQPVTEADYVSYYHAMSLSGYNSQYLWGEAGLYRFADGRLQQITARPALDYAQDTVTGDYYIVTHEDGVRILVHDWERCGNEIAVISPAGRLTVALSNEPANGLTISDIPKAENGVVRFRTAGREGMAGTYYNEYEMVNGKVRVVQMSWLFFNEESEAREQERLDELGIGIGA